MTLSGVFDNDFQSGEWKWFRSDKKLDSLITFTKGRYNGLYQVWHQNGEQAIIGKYLNDFAIDSNKKTSKFFRITNEVPTIILIVVVFVVVFKPL